MAVTESHQKVPGEGSHRISGRYCAMSPKCVPTQSQGQGSRWVTEQRGGSTQRKPCCARMHPTSTKGTQGSQSTGRVLHTGRGSGPAPCRGTHVLPASGCTAPSGRSSAEPLPGPNESVPWQEWAVGPRRCKLRSESPRELFKKCFPELAIGVCKTPQTTVLHS